MAIGGHRYLILWSSAFRFSELKAFDAPRFLAVLLVVELYYINTSRLVSGAKKEELLQNDVTHPTSQRRRRRVDWVK